MTNPSICADGTSIESSTSRLKEWLAILSVSIGAFILVTSEFLPVGILNEVAGDLGISVGTAGWMITLPGIIAAAAAALITVGIGNLDRRRLLVFLTFMMVIANLTVAFASEFGLVLTGRVLLGISIGGFWATAIALSPRLAPKGIDVAKSTSIIMAGVTLATVLGVPAGTWLSGQFGWRSTFAITAAVGVVIGIIQAMMLPSLKPEQSVRLKDLPVLFLHSKARIGIISMFFIGLAHFAAFSYVAPFFRNAADFDVATISSLLLMYGAAGFFGNLFAGYAAARNVRLTMLFVATLIIAAVLLLPTIGTHLTGAMVLIGMWGFAFGAFPTTVNIWMFQVAPQKVERGMPLIVTTFQCFIAIGSFFGGQLVDRYGMTALFVISALLAAIGAFVTLRFGKMNANA